MPPETVHELHDGFGECHEEEGGSAVLDPLSESIVDTENQLSCNPLGNEVDSLRGRFASGAESSEIYGKLLQLQAQSRALAATIHSKVR